MVTSPTDNSQIPQTNADQMAGSPLASCVVTPPAELRSSWEAGLARSPTPRGGAGTAPSVPHVLFLFKDGCFTCVVFGLRHTDLAQHRSCLHEAAWLLPPEAGPQLFCAWDTRRNFSTCWWPLLQQKAQTCREGALRGSERVHFAAGADRTVSPASCSAGTCVGPLVFTVLPRPRVIEKVQDTGLE